MPMLASRLENGIQSLCPVLLELFFTRMHGDATDTTVS
jgi:hypothetical protein